MDRGIDDGVVNCEHFRVEAFELFVFFVIKGEESFIMSEIATG